jgi:Zn-dependent protease with chaperone function
VTAVTALRKAGLKWGLAVIYLLLCVPLIWLFPGWLRLTVVVAYVLYFLWNYLTVETEYARSLPVRPLSRWEMPHAGQFRAQLTEACREAGLRREPIWAVVYDEVPNAIAVSGRRGLVIFTTALLRSFPPEEVLAIAGHELNHLADRDSLPAILGGTWLGLLGYISASLRRAGDSMRNTLMAPVCVILALIFDVCIFVLGWVAEAVLSKRSRFQEHQADLAGARLTSVATMSSALARLEQKVGTMRPPERAARWTPAWVADKLYASHPPTAERIAYLQTAMERGELSA